MSVCGRCRGRGVIKPVIGFGDQECPACGGNGVKSQRSSLGRRKVTIPLPAGAWCVACGDRPAVQMHHVVSQNHIERYVPQEQERAAKADPRNGVPTCVHCHGGLDDGTIKLPQTKLPRGFWRFVADYDLRAALPRYLTCGAAADQSSQSSSADRGAVVSRTRSPREENA